MFRLRGTTAALVAASSFSSSTSSFSVLCPSFVTTTTTASSLSLAPAASCACQLRRIASSPSPSSSPISNNTTNTSSPASTSNSKSSVSGTEQQRQLAQIRAAAANVTAYINLHSSNVNVSKPRVALQAWREIDELPEQYIEIADVDSVVKLLNAFTYFHRVWERGHDGPAQPLPKRERAPNGGLLHAGAAGSKTAAADPEEIVIPPDFYQNSTGRAKSFMETMNAQRMQMREARAVPQKHQQQGGGATRGFQHRAAADAVAGGAGGNNSGGGRFASRPAPKARPAEVVGEMIE